MPRKGNPKYKIDENLLTIYFCQLCEQDTKEEEFIPNFESWRKQGKQKVIVGICSKCKQIHE